MAEYTSGAFKTSSTNYEVRLIVTLINSDANNAKCKAILTPQLRRVGAGATRYQHRWNVFFKADALENIRSYKGGAGYEALPNRLSGTNVESAGNMYMTAGTWYTWGESYEFEIDNDGKTHSFGIRMECVDTIPRTCPQAGYATINLTTAKYKVAAPTPVLKTPVFNEDTRELTYSWNAVDTTKCDYIQLHRDWFNADGNLIAGKSGYVGTNDKLLDTTTSFTEKLSEEVASVSYRLYIVSTSGDVAKSGDKEFTVATDDKVWVYINNKWVKAIPWVKVDGVWKKVTKTYVNINGTWKRTIM